jgi:uncharacterized protein (TIGR03000 family)
MHAARSLSVAGLVCLALLALTPFLASQDKGQQAFLKISVPANAIVEIEGVRTTQTGEVRRYVSPPLVPGKKYTYTVKVTWKDAEGKEQSVQEVLRIEPGQTTEHDFRGAAAAVKKEEKKVEEVKKEEEDRRPDVIFVPTAHGVVKKMLEVAKVGKDDVVYDLGCGDGRIVVAAAKDFGCKKAMGFDVDPERIKESTENVRKNNVGDKVTIVKKDIFTLDLTEANVITLYLLPSLNVKLIPQLDKLKPGSRIVSHDFDMEGVEPEPGFPIDVEAVDDNGNKRTHRVYYWTTPLKKKKVD